jgi:hypothetical protein
MRRGKRLEVGADLTSGPSGSRMQARNGLHQRVGAGPRHGARAHGEGRGWERAWAARARWAAAGREDWGRGYGGPSGLGGLAASALGWIGWKGRVLGRKAKRG